MTVFAALVRPDNHAPFDEVDAKGFIDLAASRRSARADAAAALPIVSGGAIKIQVTLEILPDRANVALRRPISRTS